MNDANLLNDPDFQKLLLLRSRWRWGLSGLLVGAYLLYAVGGIYFADAYATPVMGSSIPWGIGIGYLIMAASIALSIAYVRVINRLAASVVLEPGKVR